MSKHVRTCTRSDGTVQIWRWPLECGHGYMGPEVQYSEKIVRLSRSQRDKIEKREDRVEAADRRIQRKGYSLISR